MKPLANVPPHVALTEAAALFEFMVTKKTTRTEFLYKRHKIIFDALEWISRDRYFIGTRELIDYLTDEQQLNEAGGEAYIKKIFAGFEPAEAV